MHIRPLKETDFGKLSKIYCDAYNPLDIGEKWDTASAEKLLRHLHSAQSDLFFVAEIENEQIGAICGLIKPWWDGNHLTDGEFFIDPKHQRRGIGKLLVKHLFEQAKTAYNAISWETFTHVVHEHPLKWYKSIGFEVIQEWTMINGNIDTVLSKLRGYKG